FFGIPVILMTYSMSVIPIIVSSFFATKLEKLFANIVPDVVKTFIVPMATMLVIIPLTFMIIGPLATWASQLLGQGTIWLYDLSPIVAGAILGGFWLVFVMFGLHWGLVPIALNNITSQGWDPILALIFVHSFALAVSVLAVWIKTKNQKTKTLSASSLISAIFGVTEPAMYGIALPLKKPFFFPLISSAIGGAILGMFGTIGYIMGGLGIFQIPSFISPDGIDMSFIGAIIAAVIGTVLAFVLTYFFGGINKEEKGTQKTIEPDSSTEEVEVNIKSEVIESPLNGEINNLADISDSAFASGALGKGVAIKPTEGKLISPVTGTISVLFGTQHAIGIKTEYGAEVLIHIGMDTVQLDGEHFKAHVSQGDHIEKGQLLIEFNIMAIEKAGYDIITPVVITNYDQYEKIEVGDQKNIEIGQSLIKLESKTNN